MFELDVCFTKDKQLVVNHDSNLLRTTGKNVDISELNF
jgi:glycerophosphoryl diester phosphodiesterase